MVTVSDGTMAAVTVVMIVIGGSVVSVVDVCVVMVYAATGVVPTADGLLNSAPQRLVWCFVGMFCNIIWMDIVNSMVAQTIEAVFSFLHYI